MGRPSDMFGISEVFNMIGTYEDRKVARYECDEFTVDTCEVTDSEEPYETGIEHHDYHDGWVIVEMYDTKEEAKEGHERWAKKMKENPPDELVDVGTCPIGELLNSFGENRYPRRNHGESK